jgi:hypothetical protein
MILRAPTSLTVNNCIVGRDTPMDDLSTAQDFIKTNEVSVVWICIIVSVAIVFRNGLRAIYWDYDPDCNSDERCCS